MANDVNDLQGSIKIVALGKSTAKYSIVAARENDISSAISTKQHNNLVANMNLYSDFVIENPGWGTAVYGYQKRFELYVLNRFDIPSELAVKPNSSMGVSYRVVEPPKITLNLPTTKDTFIRESIPRLNYGLEKSMMIGYSSNLNEHYKSLVEFDINSIPNNNTSIVSAKLKLVNVIPNAESTRVGIYTAGSNWDEQGVTWNNQPYISSLVSSSTVPSNSSNVEFDVTNIVQKWYDKTEENNGFIIKFLDENQDQTLQFSTKENNIQKPILEVVYVDTVVYSYGRTDITSSLASRRSSNKDINCSVGIASHNVVTDFVSRMGISRQELNSKIRVTKKETSSLSSTISVRNRNLNDFASKISISKQEIRSKIIVPNESKINSSVSVRRSSDNRLISKISISSPDKLSSIYVKYNNNIDSSVSIRSSISNNLDSLLSISRPDIGSKIRVVIKDKTELPGSISVRRFNISNLNSNLSVSRSDLPSNIHVVYSNYLSGSLTVKQKQSSSLQSTIGLLYRKDLPSTIKVVGASMISSSIRINSGFLKSNLMVPYRTSKSINSSIKVRAVYISDIECTIIIGGRGHYVFIM